MDAKANARNKRYRKGYRGRYTALRRKAKAYKQLLTLSYDEYVRIAAMPCHYCNRPVTGAGYGLDKKDPKTGYILSNVVSCCWRCNKVKSDVLTPTQMKRVAKFLGWR